MSAWRTRRLTRSLTLGLTACLLLPAASARLTAQAPAAARLSKGWLEFRTQNPQVALDSRLEVVYGSGQRFEVSSAGASSDPGILTWNHYMRFPIPATSLAHALQSHKVLLSVGSLAEYLEPEQLEALRDLLSRVGAFPPAAAPEDGC
jgi:hypothetical protein